MKCLNSDESLTDVSSERFNEQWTSVASDNGLAASRRQAIIWNDGEIM